MSATIEKNNLQRQVNQMQQNIRELNLKIEELDELVPFLIYQ